jgi:hypothetical protein
MGFSLKASKAKGRSRILTLQMIESIRIIQATPCR